MCYAIEEGIVKRRGENPVQREEDLTPPRSFLHTAKQ